MFGWLIVAIAVLLAIFFGVDKANSISLAKRAPRKVADWLPEASAASSETGVPVQFILAQIWQESAGDPDAVGGAGEVGLMQLKEIAVQDVNQNFTSVNIRDWRIDPAENIRAGAYFLKLQRKRAESWEQAFGFYNQGERGAEQNPELAAKYRREVMEKVNYLEGNE